jgi:hypothetical protein
MLRTLVLTLIIAITSINASFASPSELGKAKSAIKRIRSEESKLTKSFRKLSETERAKLKSTTRGVDSDGDGLPDVIEAAIGSNRCDADTDDDGLDDNGDSDERDSDGDDDGVPDGNEVETKGLIQSFNDPVLVVGSTTLTITASTVFFRGLSSKADLQASTCVEAESHKVGADLLVQKIKKHTGTECGAGSGGDDRGDDGGDDKGRR